MLHRGRISFALLTLAFATSIIDTKNALRRTSMIDTKYHQTKSVEMIRCLVNCDADFSFNDSVIIPASCRTYSNAGRCGVSFEMDYVRKTGSISFAADNATDIVFETGLLVDARFSFEPNVERKALWSYECATDNDCATKYFQKHISHYIGLTEQLETLQNLMSSLLYNDSNLPTVHQCYRDRDTFEDCQSGICTYSWVGGDNSTTNYACEPAKVPVNVYYQIFRTDPTIPASPMLDEVRYVCNTNKCNSFEYGVGIRLAIATKWGGILDTNSTATNLITGPRYALLSVSVILMKFLC
ncbi:unnamed protein product [Adineta ricciae]|uniref:Uncharacterized protein n=1 Tax=Adineta ricciae TaxID=249248 RepID=A0A815LXF0_ADIRI|nr:unnamed protein product [Adineta ricciae]CAF1410036.1 unnamed protein product [Adineta ricciae]